MFHLTNGLYFERLDDGSVRIVKTDGPAGPDDDGSVIEFDITTDASGWASVVATVSAHGEEDGGWQRALDFHGAE